MNFIIKADICYAESKDQLVTKKNGYLICKDGLSKGVFDEIPDKFKDYKLYDYTNKLVIPGLIDLHLHAPQNYFKGMGMDLELLEWLNHYTFPEESKYIDLDYAKRRYEYFKDELVRSPSTRFSIFGTIYKDSTEILMDIMEESGLISFVGKVNMDINSPPYYTEKSAKESYEDTIKWIEDTKDKYKNTKAIITPRFIPTCSDELLTYLGDISKDYDMPVQSHLSENLSEIEWVKELHPKSLNYASVYDKYNLLGGKDKKTIMAHCVWSDQSEQELIKKNGVFIAHCPNSNMNVASGIAPIRKYLDDDQKVGLGTDVAGGVSLSIFKAMSDAIQVSKLRWRLKDQSLVPLSVEEAFYLGTKGGGEFFGKCGSFEDGYEFDAIVIDEDRFSQDNDWSIPQRIERIIYLSEDSDIMHKFVKGKKLF